MRMFDNERRRKFLNDLTENEGHYGVNSVA